MINATIKLSNYLGGKQVLDDRRRGMLDCTRQAEAGNRQHDERRGWAAMQDEQMMDNVRRSGGRAMRGNPAVGDTTGGRGGGHATMMSRMSKYIININFIHLYHAIVDKHGINH
jgi:hypothetical protein